MTWCGTQKLCTNSGERLYLVDDHDEKDPSQGHRLCEGITGKGLQRRGAVGQHVHEPHAQDDAGGEALEQPRQLPA
jgi:hypothetical protein